MSLSELSIKRPSFIIVIFTVLLFGGYVAYKQLSYELLPKFSEPAIGIAIVYPGASPSEVESSVTTKVENALSGVENLDYISSRSVEGISSIQVFFQSDVDLDVAIQNVQRRIDNIKNQLPTEIRPPSINKFSPDDIPILRLSATSNLSSTDFYTKMDKELIPQIGQVKGVGSIGMIGGEQRVVRVDIDKNKLKAYNLSILQVSDAVAKSNLEFPTGKIEDINQSLTLKLAGKYTTLEDIENLLISSSTSSGPVYLRDIAAVYDGKKPIKSISRLNGTNAIGIIIQKQADANAVEMSKLVREQLKKIEEKYKKENIHFEIAQDISEFTVSAADAVEHDLMIAIILVGAIMLLFLHSFRNALIVMVAIPCSLVSTFIAMYLLGYTLNLMTLLAMSLVIGILVDDSIVVLENIYRHLEMGKKSREAALDGREEIGFTALSITLVDVVVFFPIVLVDGMISNILRQFSVMVVVSTLMSLFVSFTITPMLASRFSKLEHLTKDTLFGRVALWFESQIDKLSKWYGKVVVWALTYKWAVGLIIVGAFVFVGWVMGLGIVGSEFVSKGDKGEFVVNLKYPSNYSIEANNKYSLQIENDLLSRPEVVSVFSNVGGSTNFQDGGIGKLYETELMVKLKPAEERSISTENYMIAIQKELQKKYTGVDVGTGNIGIMGGADQAPIEIILFCENLDTLMTTAHKIKDLVYHTDGTNATKLSIEDGNPEVKIDVDRDKMYKLGLNMAVVGASLQNSFSGNDNAKFKEKENEFDILIKLDAFDKSSIEDVASQNFMTNTGQLVRLDEFAKISLSNGPSALERKYRMPSVKVYSQVLGKPDGNVVADIQNQLKGTYISPKVTIEYGGNAKRQGESMGSLGLALLSSILLVYLIMVALYDSFVYPFVVLFSIPVAVVGALLALAFSQSSLSIFTMLGMIMLVGLVAKNAILIVDFTNQLKEEGHSTFDALVEAGKARLRPILMTTIAMVIGMIPIAIAKGAGAEWKNGLAWALIGGLLSSMFLTLILVPVMYALIDRLKNWVEHFFKKDDEILPPALDKE